MSKYLTISFLVIGIGFLFLGHAYPSEALVKSVLTSPFIPLVLLCSVFYFFLIRPQHKKARSHRIMLESLRKGDQVITAGGVIGIVVKSSGEQEVEVEIAKGVVAKFVKSTITQVTKGETLVLRSNKEVGKQVTKLPASGNSRKSGLDT